MERVKLEASLVCQRNQKFQVLDHRRFYVHIKPARPLLPNCDPSSLLLSPNFQFCQLAKVLLTLVRIRSRGINCEAKEAQFWFRVTPAQNLNQTPVWPSGLGFGGLAGFQCKPVWILSAVVNFYTSSHKALCFTI